MGYGGWDLRIMPAMHGMHALAPLGVLSACLHVDSHVVEITHTHTLWRSVGMTVVYSKRKNRKRLFKTSKCQISRSSVGIVR